MAIRLDGHLGALFDGRRDMVEADGALEEGEQRVRVHGARPSSRLASSTNTDCIVESSSFTPNPLRNQISAKK